MSRMTRDAKVKAAFDRFHSTPDRKAAVSRLHTDMRKAGGPMPKEEEK